MSRRALTANVDTAVEVTKAIVVLHHFLMNDKNVENRNSYCPPNFLDEDINGDVRPGG